MKAFDIIKSTTRSFIGKASMGLRKNAPTIFIVAGAAGVVTGFVLAIKAGKNSDDSTAQAREDLEKVHAKKEEAYAEPENPNEEKPYTKADYAKDLTHAYLNLCLAYARTYGPAALTTAFSLLLIFKSHKMLKKENALTYASLVATTKAYDAYRRHVIEEEGLEADERYRFGIKAIEQERELLDKNGNPKLDKEGNPKKIREKVNMLTEPDIIDIRSALWAEETAKNFDFNPIDGHAMNVHTVLMAQEAANNILVYRSKDPRNNGIGWIYLNEVLSRLGLPEWDIGQVVGWLYDPRLDPTSPKYDPRYKAPDDWGDNRVDFGIENPDVPGYEARQAFRYGDEEAILLYLNYSGVIADKVGLRTKYWSVNKRR